MKLQDLLDEHGIPYRQVGESHHVTEGFLGIDCPFCSRDSGKFKLGYSLNGGFFTCWSCGYHRTIDVLSELTGKPSRECYELIGKIDRDYARREKIQGKLQLPSGVGTLLPIHKNYLIGRGFNPKTLVKLWSLMGIGLNYHLSWRILIPIHYHGQMVSWTTRSVGKDEKRYINASSEQEQMHAKDLLYGEDYCRHGVVVVEGPADTWRMGPGSVAVLGTSIGNSQVEKILKYPVRAVCFDREVEAQQRALALCSKLEASPGKTTNIVLETGKDPAEADQKEIQEIRRRFLE